MCDKPKVLTLGLY